MKNSDISSNFKNNRRISYLDKDKNWSKGYKFGLYIAFIMYLRKIEIYLSEKSIYED